MTQAKRSTFRKSITLITELAACFALHGIAFAAPDGADAHLKEGKRALAAGEFDLALDQCRQGITDLTRGNSAAPVQTDPDQTQELAQADAKARTGDSAGAASLYCRALDTYVAQAHEKMQRAVITMFKQVMAQQQLREYAIEKEERLALAERCALSDDEFQKNFAGQQAEWEIHKAREFGAKDAIVDILTKKSLGSGSVPDSMTVSKFAASMTGQPKPLPAIDAASQQQAKLQAQQTIRKLTEDQNPDQLRTLCEKMLAGQPYKPKLMQGPSKVTSDTNGAANGAPPAQ